MVPSRAQSPARNGGDHLVLYDGMCGLCSRLVQFLLRHDHRRVFLFAPLHSNVGLSIVKQSGGNPVELTSFYVVADYDMATSRVFTRSDAALFVAGKLGWPWKAARWLGVVPKAIRDRAYDLVARNRYRVFRRSDRCAIAHPRVQGRFIG